MALHELKTWMREACAKIDNKILCAIWQDVECRVVLLEPLVALTSFSVNNYSP